MKFNLKILAITLCLIMPSFHSCTSVRQMADNQREEGHYRLYSFPHKIKKDKKWKKRYKRIVIAGSNNFEGNISPTIYPIANRFGEKRTLRVGGIAAMKSYFDILRDEYKDELVTLDAGSFLDQENNHEKTLFLYRYLNYDMAAIGLNEFLIKNDKNLNFQTYIKYITRNSKVKLLNSNLFDLSQAEQIDWPGVEQVYLKEKNGLKIGFLSVLTTDLTKKIPDNVFNGLYIQNPAKNIIKYANLLRRKGAHIVILTTGNGIDCTSQMADEKNLSQLKVNFYPKESKHCDYFENELSSILKSLPPKTVDAIFTSGSKSKVANFIHGYPVLQNPGYGHYLSWAEIYFDTKHNQIDQSKTIIRQPIQLCHQFLKDHSDCFTGEPLDHKELAPAVFLGKQINIKELPKFQ